VANGPQNMEMKQNSSNMRTKKDLLKYCHFTVCPKIYLLAEFSM
jgi:hypothetical protein